MTDGVDSTMSAQLVEDVLGAGHIALLLGLAVCFPLLRWVLHTVVFVPLSRRLLRPALLTADGKPATGGQGPSELQVEKLCESLWKLLVYTVLMVMGITTVWGQPWLRDTRDLWQGWPSHEFTAPMRALYDAELAFYVSSVFMILFWEVRRNDFPVMFTHHVITVALIGASLRLRFWRAGVLVMALHDPSDVALEAAKAFNYLRADVAATAAFAAFGASWAALRLAVLPWVVIRSALLELPAALGGRPPMWWGFCGGLLLLLCLHAYWFTLIVRVAWMRAVTGGGRDLREDDDM
ncbi:MAG: LAG1-domain-containing protein [Monoraphidium minutum]|nr:MAG: LAG1-domain-containing protein [Monoraphidium minutum]